MEGSGFRVLGFAWTERGVSCGVIATGWSAHFSPSRAQFSGGTSCAPAHHCGGAGYDHRGEVWTVHDKP